jgi:hypothetical protein
MNDPFARLDTALESATRSVDRVSALTDKLVREEEQRFWDDFGWAQIKNDADRNMDQVPPFFGIDFGCPECGTAWGELRALGFTAPRIRTGVAYFMDERPCILLDTDDDIHTARIRAVRIVCLNDHVIDVDGVTRRSRIVEAPMPGLALAMASAAVMMFGYLAARKL